MRRNFQRKVSAQHSSVGYSITPYLYVNRYLAKLSAADLLSHQRKTLFIRGSGPVGCATAEVMLSADNAFSHEEK